MIEITRINEAENIPKRIFDIEFKEFKHIANSPKSMDEMQCIYPTPGLLFVKMIDGSEVGYLYFYNIDKNIGYIWSCVVAPEWRGRGYFIELIKKLNKTIEINTYVSLSSNNNNVTKVMGENGFEKIKLVDKKIITKIQTFNKKFINYLPWDTIENYYPLINGKDSPSTFCLFKSDAQGKRNTA